MNRRAFLGSMFAGIPAVARGAVSTPNIVIILADDLGYGDLGCYGQQRIATPNLDRMAVEGMRFLQAYAGSCVCAPSRCCLMTGMHTGHARVRDNLPHGVALQPDDVTVAEVLRRAGYRTGAIGKWHIGDKGTLGGPLHQGFDEFFGYINGDHAHFYYPQFLWENDKEWMLVGNRGGARGQYAPDLFTEQALRFLDAHHRAPFFLYLPYILPHWSDYREGPRSLDVPPDPRYAEENWPEVAKNYASMVTRLDGYVGRILNAIRQHGVEQNTLVLFTSDNGPSAERLHRPGFFESAGPLRGVKRDMYEGGVRVPLIARWPGSIRPGVSDHPCASWDILPTAAELAGVPAPSRIDGISILAALQGKTQRRHEHFYWEYGHVRDTFKQGIRAGEWKGVRVGARSQLELYNLRSDPSESHNVAAEHAEIAARLSQMMAAARTDSPDYPIRELQ